MRPVPPPPPPKLSTAPSPLPPLPAGPMPPPPGAPPGSPPPGLPGEPPWPVLDPAARYGLAGEIVDLIEPHSEADPVPVLAQLLSAVGVWIGPGPYVLIGASRHSPRIFTAVVGETSTGRKGESLGQVRRVLKLADPAFESECWVDGISTGEGLINAIRDPDGKDPGVPDKRLFVAEEEFAAVMIRAGRPGSILSTVLRRAWDGGTLRVITRNKPLRASGSHVGASVHVTPSELATVFGTTDRANGLGNRFLWVCSRSPKQIPRGGKLRDGDLGPIVTRLVDVVARARSVEEVPFTERGGAMYDAAYLGGHRRETGMVAAMTDRWPATTARLALLYALLDGAAGIDTAHVAAALALARYGADSVRHILGSVTGDERADRILDALHAAGAAGLTRTQIRDLFGRHRAADVTRALVGLEVARLARVTRTGGTGGRPVETWYAVGGAP